MQHLWIKTTVAAFAIANDLMIGSTFFPHKDIHKYTWVLADGHTTNQIYHLSIHQKHKSALMDVRSYCGTECDSGHNMVVAKVKVKLNSY